MAERRAGEAHVHAPATVRARRARTPDARSRTSRRSPTSPSSRATAPAGSASSAAATEPGSLLVTVSGAVARHGITELPSGTPLQALIDAYGGVTEPVQARSDRRLLRHLGAGRRRRSTPRSRRRACGRSAPRWARARSPRSRSRAAACARPRGSSTTWRARAPASAAPASSGCAPSPTRSALAAPSATPAHPRRWRDSRRLAPQVTDRGACAHPNGATRLVESALDRVRRRGRAPSRGRLLRTLARAAPADPAGDRGMAMSRTTHPSARQPDPLRRLRPLRRAAARADLAGRVGLPDHRRAAPCPTDCGARRAAPSRYARGSRSCSSSGPRSGD